MKPTVFPHTVAALILGLLTQLPAQNLESCQTTPDGALNADGTHGVLPRFTAVSAPGDFLPPAPAKAQGLASDDPAVIAAQDSATLNASLPTRRKVESVVDLDVLRGTSPYRKAGDGNALVRSEVATESLQQELATISATYRESGQPAKSSDCQEISLSVEQRIKLDTSKLLEIVELEVGANPSCACETVKTAIKASEAGVDEVVAIVEAAIHAAPDTMRIVSQCAIAANPDAIAGVQALLARLDPNSGDTGYSSKSAKSAKDSKGAKVAAIIAPPLPDPLDLPPSGPPMPPPPIIPPPVTDVDP